MNTELITTQDELAALESTWNELAGGMPFRSWDWLATWWKHYGSAERQLYVLAVHESDREGERRLMGIAPWYLDRSVLGGTVVRWLGSGEVCTDHLSLVCRPERRAEVAEQVAEALTASCDDWDRLDLSAVDSDDETMACLFDQLANRECVVSKQSADGCWVLELPASWEDYLAAVSKSHRKQLRQLERRVLEGERTRWHSVTSARDLPRAWEVLVDLHQRRRKSLGEPGCFASRPFHDFHREVAERLLERGELRMSWLELDGSPIAAEYHFAGATTTYAYQGGVDPERLNEEPGRLSTILCFRAAIDEGHKRFDFLRGDEPYKAHWRATLRETFDCRVVPNRRLAKLRGRVLNLTGVVTDWVRQGAHVFAD